jgi:integrase
MTQEEIQAYLDSKAMAWSETTRRSETSRLKSVASLVELANPQAAYTKLLSEGYGAYSIKTIFVRLAALQAWRLQTGRARGKNHFADYLKSHARLFKYAYKKERLALTFEEAKKKLAELAPEERLAAESLLKTGLRISEFTSVIDGQVIGKGGKPREVFADVPVYGKSLATLRRKLKTLGLKPHSLRKLCATRLLEAGLSTADLCEIFGWADIRTANSYVQPKRASALRAAVEQI